jgi:hypothetical protein
MWTIYDQPWTLVALGGISFLAVMTYRAFCPDKARMWQLGIPVAIAAAAFALDVLVVTDSEKIRTLVTAAEEAGRKGDVASLENLLADDYHDSFHGNKQRLVERARIALTNSPIKAIKEIHFGLAGIEPPSATATLLLVTTFKENSLVAAAYKPSLMAKLDLRLAKQPDRRWLIQSVELVEVDKQPLSWGRTTGF